MKIALVASEGGHLTQARTIFSEEVIGNNEAIYFTERNPKTEKLPGKKYFFKEVGYNPFNYPYAILKCLLIFKREKPSVVITTGADIGLVGMIAGKLLGIKTIFIDTIIRVKTPTWAGKLSYPFSDIFLVQIPGMEKHYGKRARYVGGIV
ncbi:MAG: capsular biosynthesis protein [archaeon]